MQKQGRVPLKDVTDEEILFSKSDPEPDLDDNKDFSYSKPQKQLKPKKQAENHKDTIVHKYITCSSCVTSFKLPRGS